MAKRKPRSDVIGALRRASADEALAVEFLEEMRWGKDPRCPTCDSDNVYKLGNRKTGGRNDLFRWQCRACKRQYTVRIGTVMEQTGIPLRHWCFAFWQASASKKGVSALQVSRETEISYKSALFLMHRVRFAMAEDTPRKLRGDVEADETYVGGKPRHRRDRREKWTNKAPVLALVERGGKVRAAPVERVTARTVGHFLRSSADPKQTLLLTDESPIYNRPGGEFLGHATVNHRAKEYVRGDIHTNTIEGFFSLIKRGMYGTFHSVSRKHLHRYISEFEFRYNTRWLDDGERTRLAIRGGIGKRLRYSFPVEKTATLRFDLT